MSDDTLELTIEESTSTTEEEVTGDVWELMIETGLPGPAGSDNGDHGSLTGLGDPDHPSTAITVPTDTLSVIDPDLIYDDVYDQVIALGADATLAGIIATSAATYITEQPTTVQKALINSAALIGPLLAASSIALINAAGAVPKSLVDAKGDLIVATADDTVDRLPVDTDGKVLTADSGEAAGMKWETPATGIPSSRTINTTAPLTGGGDLSADRTIALATPPNGLYVSGSLYLSWSPTSGGTRSVAPGSVVFWPVILDGPAVLNGLSIDVTTGGASGAGHLYLVTASATTGRPTSSSTILATASNIATATNSTRVTASFDASATVSLGPGWAWAMFHSITGTPTLRSTAAGWFAPPPVQATTSSTANGLACINGTGAGTSSTALTTLSGITIASPDLNQAPLIQWRVA